MWRRTWALGWPPANRRDEAHPLAAALVVALGWDILGLHTGEVPAVAGVASQGAPPVTIDLVQKPGAEWPFHCVQLLRGVRTAPPTPIDGPDPERLLALASEHGIEPAGVPPRGRHGPWAAGGMLWFSRKTLVGS